MSRYTITVTRTASRHSDPDAIIGYDRPLQTFFLQAFPDAGGENLELWLGTDLREFETLSQLRAAAIARGFDFIPMGSGILHKLLDDHAREAHHTVSDTINGTSAR
ncbi:MULTISPECIES: hypothetical protein [Rhizobium]|uniref:Uncharacterized protein n=1 Tax=Rhizobium laguerreae TaxID=1076926 RepID=A0AAX2QC17_9HYPH|nr:MULTISPECIES: hypothetical protein [Rhizobium]NKM94256.1 hypothetical protein [Rhizobium leguminosarum bv. viciae]TCU15557.1 hypothetical protein EV131_119104 [Rhizobium laguerreae]